MVQIRKVASPLAGNSGTEGALHSTYAFKSLEQSQHGKPVDTGAAKQLAARFRGLQKNDHVMLAQYSCGSKLHHQELNRRF